MTTTMLRVHLRAPLGALLLGALLGLAPAALPAREPRAASPEVGLSATESALVERTNDERARRGLPPLAADAGLMAGARRHAAWMAGNRTLAHGRGVTENIAMGQSNAGHAVGDWMRSDGHRANILGRGHSRIGVAVARAADGTLYWCQQFR